VIRTAAILLAAATLALTLGASGASVSTATQGSTTEDWRTFTGSWSARGRRQTLPIEDGGTAAIVYLSGAVVLAKGTELGGGMFGEAIAFDDGRSLATGRAVWTDSHGDRIFSELKGEPVATGRRVVGAITGGTGHFAGMVGDYELTWQYVAHGDEDEVQGRAVDLRGRFRTGMHP
jgi:hypothetical protein